jgi:tellurite resistance-related uncharacterized protein
MHVGVTCGDRIYSCIKNASSGTSNHFRRLRIARVYRKGGQNKLKALPSTLRPYRQTPVFDENSLPAGLLKSHSTKTGVWGKIIVLEGKLVYRILEPDVEEILLTPEIYGVVEPTVKHEVVPGQSVRFYVEFYQ